MSFKLPKRIRLIRNAFWHPGAGRNATFARLARQSLPYVFRRDGYSYPPLTVYLSVNSICNFKCKMCDIGQGNTESTFYRNLNPGGNAQLQLERIEDLLEEVRRFKPLIAITTTEPLLYRPLPKVIEQATRRGMETLVTTNGFNIAKKAEELVDAGLRTLYISLDGPPSLHNEIRGVPRSFETALEGIRRLAEIRTARSIDYPQVRVGFTVSNFNYDKLYELARILKKEPIECLTVSHLNFVTPENAGKHNASFSHVGTATMTSLAGGADPSNVDIQVLARQIQGVKKEFSGFVYFSPDLCEEELYQFYRRPNEVVWDNKCLIPWYIAEIIANGEVIPMTRCFDVKLGNIYDSSFEEIWNGTKMRSFRKALQKEKLFPACMRCRGCL